MIDPPGRYFRLAKNGRTHLIRQHQHVLVDSRPLITLLFWCANISHEDRGQFLQRPLKGETVCPRCVRHRPRVGI